MRERFCSLTTIYVLGPITGTEKDRISTTLLAQGEGFFFDGSYGVAIEARIKITKFLILLSGSN